MSDKALDGYKVHGVEDISGLVKGYKEKIINRKKTKKQRQEEEMRTIKVKLADYLSDLYDLEHFPVQKKMFHYFKKILLVHEMGKKYRGLKTRKQEYMPLMRLCSDLVDKTVSKMKKDYRNTVSELVNKSKKGEGKAIEYVTFLKDIKSEFDKYSDFSKKTPDKSGFILDGTLDDHIFSLFDKSGKESLLKRNSEPGLRYVRLRLFLRVMKRFQKDFRQDPENPNLSRIDYFSLSSIRKELERDI